MKFTDNILKIKVTLFNSCLAINKNVHTLFGTLYLSNQNINDLKAIQILVDLKLIITDAAL